MRAEHVTDALDFASACDSAAVLHKFGLLSDNGPTFVAGELGASPTSSTEQFLSCRPSCRPR